MKIKKIMVYAVLVLMLPIIQLVINKLYSLYYDKTYINLNDSSKLKNFEILKVTTTGRLDFVHTDLSENNISVIHFDTVTLNFKIIAKKYIKNNNEETDCITFDSNGKILEMDKYIPRETENDYFIDYERVDGKGNLLYEQPNVKIDSIDHFKNCIVVGNQIPPFPKWKDKASPIYVHHFSKDDFNGRKLNPFRLGGINGNSVSSVWYGLGYCNVRFEDEIIRIKIPFGMNSLFLSATDFDYYAQLNYYSLPEPHLNKVPVRLLVLNDDIYLIRRK
jgi:hypothetical protein